jgi:hypothetical protein
MTTVKPEVTFHRIDPKGGYLTAQLGNGAPAISGGGGWSVVSREKQVGMTEWTGYDPYTMDIPIVFDGFVDDTSVEANINSLYWLMRTPVGSRHEPAVLTISGPVPHTNLRWVINNIAPSTTADDEIRNDQGQRVRFTAVVTLIEHVPGNVLVSHKKSPAKHHKASKGRKGTTSSTRTYIVRRGDTLGSIAARLLHSSSKWHDIAKANGIRDPNSIKVGQKLKIPAS